MAAPTLPETVPQFPGSTMTFEIVDGTYCETTRWSGNDDHPFAVPPHWHEFHDEIIIVHASEGGIDLCRDGRWERFLADPKREITISRNVVHSFKAVPGIGPMMFRERTVGYGPLKDQPEFKALFFRDLFHAPSPGFWHVMRTFRDSDTYFKIPLVPKFACRIFTSVMAAIARIGGSHRVLTLEDYRKMK